MKLKYLLLLPVLVLLASCDELNGPKDVALGEVFELKVSQTANLRGQSLSITFDGVPEDSRCPQGVECVWMGNARVALSLKQADQLGALELNTHLEPKEGTSLGYNVRLLDLKPLPIAEKPTPPDQYVAVLVVTRR